MNELDILEEMRRRKKIGYFACGNGQGVGDDRAAYCTIWGYPTSILLVTVEAPTIAQAVTNALAELEETVAPVAPSIRMPG